MRTRPNGPFGDTAATATELSADDAQLLLQLVGKPPPMVDHAGGCKSPLSSPVSHTGFRWRPATPCASDSDGNGKDEPAAKQTKRKKRNTNLSRDRMKQEIVYLRKKAAKLEEMLQRLQNGERVPIPSSDDQWLPPPPEGVSSELVSRSSPKHPAKTDNASMWENNAMRQLQQRERSEAENTKLKDSVKNQIRIIQTMEKILFKRVNSEICDEDAQNGKRLCTFSTHDPTAIEEMLTELDNLYLQTDSVFELHKMSHIETDQFDVRINTSSPLFPNLPLGMCILTTDTIAFPFTFHKTGHAMWKLIEKQTAESDVVQYRGVEHTSDTRGVSFEGAEHFNGRDVPIRGRQVVRKYLEENRVVFVYCKSTSLQTSAGLEFVAHCWSLIRPLSNNPEGCVFQYCSTVVPRFRANEPLAAPVDLPAEVGQLAELVIASVQQGRAHVRESLENILLEEG